MSSNSSTEDPNTTSGSGDCSSSIELTTPSTAVSDDVANVDIFSNKNESNSPITTRRRRIITSTTSTNPDQLSTKWEQEQNLNAIIISQHPTLNSHASKAPMRTVSYETYDSKLWSARKLSIKSAVGTYYHQNKCKLFLRSSIFGIGFVTASIGYFISWASEKVSNTYLQYNLGDNGVIENDMTVQVYGNYLGWSILFAILAFIPVAFIRPVAAGSGIAEAKAVLNGIQIPACTELLSAACKGVSIIFAVASSLPVGLEGPLIFIGMSIGENFYHIFPRHYAELRSWRMRRDLAAIGTAAGVSAAFLSPIGGILFVAEEGASYITARLLSQCFAAAITVVVFEYLYAIIGEGDAGPFAQSLERFNGLDGQKGEDAVHIFEFYDYFVIAIVGVVGGLLGACFVEASKQLTRLRQRYVTSWWKKFVEIVILAIIASTLFAWLPKVPGLSTCQSLSAARADAQYFIQFNCGENEYNDLATLLRSPLPNAINLLFWEEMSAFSAISCFVAGLTVWIVLLITFGASVAMGIFVPLLYIGAAFGRAFALAMPSTLFDVRTYAIVGATASLNGVVRVLMSLTVIMMETTDLATFVSPLMIVCLFSKWAGNALFKREGIYDEILHLRGIPFMEAEPPEITKGEVLRATDIMSDEFQTLSPVMRIADILLALQQFNVTLLDFLVTDSNDRIVGSISRATLITIIWDKKTWSQSVDEEPLSESQFQQAYSELSSDDFDFERLENITNEELSEHFDNEGDRQKYVNIAHFMTLAPITFTANGSAERAYELFRTHGLRQLIIVDKDEGKPVGVMTRYVILKALEREEEKSSAATEGAVTSNTS